MSTGATGVSGFQGPQGSYGPRGPTGLTGWSDQNSINRYGTNPTGPTGGLGYVSNKQVIISTIITSLTLDSPGTLYVFTQSGAVSQTVAITGFPGGTVAGSFWTFMIDPSARASSTVIIQVLGTTTTLIHNQKVGSGYPIALTLVYTGSGSGYFYFTTHDISTSYPVF